jgi:hypothetical protein
MKMTLTSVFQMFALRAHRRAGRSPDSRRVGGATSISDLGLKKRKEEREPPRQPKRLPPLLRKEGSFALPVKKAARINRTAFFN